MAKGWIKLHRSLLDSDIWQCDNQPFDMRSAWIDLLMLANHEDKKIIFDYEYITVERGQFITSIRKLGERWQWGKDRTLKFLRLLEKLEMITKNSDTHRTLITIENYAKFQGWQDTGEDTGKDTAQTPDRHGSATNNNDNNDKNEKNKNNTRSNKRFVKPTIEEIKAYCEQRNNGIDPEEFYNFHESKGWMIGSNKMKDWKAAVRTWEIRRKKKQEDKKPTGTKFNNFEQRKYDFDALEKEAQHTGDDE